MKIFAIFAFLTKINKSKYSSSATEDENMINLMIVSYKFTSLQISPTFYMNYKVHVTVDLRALRRAKC